MGERRGNCTNFIFIVRLNMKLQWKDVSLVGASASSGWLCDLRDEISMSLVSAVLLNLERLRRR